MSAVRVLRSATASVALAGMLIGGSQLVLAPIAQAKATQVSATTAVNVRSGPGTNHAILGVLRRGDLVTQTGPTQGGWAPVSYRGKQAWVSARYLQAGTVTSAAQPKASAPSSTARTTAALNVRTGPGTNFSVSTVLAKGVAVQLTGARQGAWVQANVNGVQRWVHSGWLATEASQPSDATGTTTNGTLPKVTGKARATTALMIRTASGPNFTSLGDIARGTVVDVTGVTEKGVAQIIWHDQVRWVNALYLVAIATESNVVAPEAPKTTGTRFASVALDIRTSSGPDSRTLSEVPAGTALNITGKVENGRAEIVWQGAARWVTARYLQLAKPGVVTLVTTNNTSGSLNTGGSVGLDALVPDAKRIVVDVRASYPITTVYGVRRDPLPDHPSGHAVDLMLPNYRANRELGWQVANHLKANASRYNIKYIIFAQHIWSVQRSGEGWRSMANRGGDTANHYDHVHVTVN